MTIGIFFLTLQSMEKNIPEILEPHKTGGRLSVMIWFNEEPKSITFNM